MAVRTVLYSEDRAAGGFEVPGSCLFDKDINQTLQWTKSANGDTRRFTISFWCRTTQPGTRGVVLGCTNNGVGSNEDGIEIDGTPVRFYSYVGGSFRFQLTTTKKFRDTGWYHVVAMFDSVQVTDSDRAKLWINGELQTEDHLATATYPSQGAQAGHFNTSGIPHHIGSINNSAHYWDGHITQLHFIDGEAIDASYFGYTDELTGVWKPKKYNYKIGGNITSTSYAIKSSEQSSDGQIATNAFDHAYTDAYASRWRNNGSEDSNIVNNAYIGQDFGSGNDKHIREVRLLQGRASSTGEMVTGVKVQYSDNGSSWSDAGSAHTIDASTFAWQTIKVASTGAHRYWRLLCSASSNSVWLVTEMSMHEYTNRPYYGTQGYYLPLDGTAPIVNDQSGNNNNFQSRRLSNSVSLDRATGALPIYNTVCGGRHPSAGIRTDALSPGKLVLALPLAGITTDVSPLLNGGSTGKTVTLEGSPGFSEKYSNYYGKSFYMENAQNQRVAFNASDDFQFTGDFCIECWVYPTNTSAGDGSIFVLQTTTGGEAYFAFNWDPGTGFNVYLNSGSSSWQPSENYVNYSDWNHFALTREGTTVKIWINGVNTESTTKSGTLGYPASQQTLTRMGGGAGSSINSYLQDFRIYKGTCKYTENFLPGSSNPAITPESPTGAAFDTDDEIACGSIALDGDGDYLSVSDSDLAPGTSNFTIECWIYPVKEGSGSYNRRILRNGDNNSTGSFSLNWNSSSQEITVNYNATTLFGSHEKQVAPRYKWTHIAWVREGTGSNETKLYIDGVKVREGTFSTDLTLYAWQIGTCTTLTASQFSFAGHISNVRCVVGTAVYTANFKPPTKPLTQIANTKLLCCQDKGTSNLGFASGTSISNNGTPSVSQFNPFTCNTIQKAGTYPTLNYLAGSDTTNGSLKKGNTWLEGSNYNKWQANFRFGPGSITTGKYYWEVSNHHKTATSHSAYTGINADFEQDSGEIWNSAYRNWFGSSSYKPYTQTGSTTSYDKFQHYNGQVFGFAVDVGARKMYVYKDGYLAITDTTLPDATTTEYEPHTFNTNDGVSGANQPSSWYNFGQRPFRFPPPKGFKPLNHEELPRPVIIRPDNYVGIVTYTGDGANTRRVTGFNFKPDLLWLKGYTATADWGCYDTVRGVTERVKLNSSDAASSVPVGTFDRNGFSFATEMYYNSSSSPYIAYGWKAGGNKGTFNVDDVAYSSWANTGISGGTITPTACSIGTKQGFSIIAYTGNSTTNATVPHGLGVAPSLVIIKSRSSNHGFAVLHTSVGETGTTVDSSPEYYMLSLDIDDARQNWSADTIWNPTTTTFKIHQSSTANWVNNSSYNYIAYAWTDIPGFQKFGSYIGNGNNSGPSVYLGFRPSILIVKKTSNDASWALCDDERNKYNNTWGSDKSLIIDTDAAETSSASFNVDLLSNGFKLRSDNSSYNEDGGTYVYMAWARSPLNTLYGGHSNAR